MYVLMVQYYTCREYAGAIPKSSKPTQKFSKAIPTKCVVQDPPSVTSEMLPQNQAVHMSDVREQKNNFVCLLCVFL